VEGVLSEDENGLQLICCARDGWLESLEVVFVSSVPPSELPDPASWRLSL
jgi:hypothetical protein